MNRAYDSTPAGVRDMLLPGIRGYSDDAGPDIELDIQGHNDGLLVVGYCLSKKRALGFAITADSLKTGRYKSEFRPNVLTLINLLKDEDGV